MSSKENLMIRVCRERTHHDEGVVVLNVQLNRSRNQYTRELDVRNDIRRWSFSAGANRREVREL